MALGKGLLSKINALLIWRVLLVLVILANIGLAGMIWMSGGDETTDANTEGRRLVYTLADSTLEGRQITSAELARSLDPTAEKKEPAAEKKPVEENKAVQEAKPAEEKKAAESSAVETPAENTDETKPAEPATEDAAATPTETPSETSVDASTDSAAEPPAVELPAAVPEEASTADAPASAPDAAATPPAVEQSPEQAAPDESQSGPVAPEPPKFDQPMPAVPEDKSGKATQLPKAAPAPPLVNQPAPAIKPSAVRLPPANPQIQEKTSDGVLPTIAQDGTKPWRFYAKPFERDGKKPMIAIIITGLGHNKTVTDHAMALNENITLSFSPYARGIEQLGASARLAGHEVMVDLPVDPANYPAADPGPYGLLLEKPPEENESRLRWLMMRIPTSVGFVTPRNERYTSSIEHTKILTQSLANRGLMLVLARDTSKNETKEILSQTTAVNVVADFVIDEDLSEATIKAKLVSIEQLALQRGFAVGIAQPYPVSVAQIMQWADTLAAKGILLVPISAVARLDYS